MELWNDELKKICQRMEKRPTDKGKLRPLKSHFLSHLQVESMQKAKTFTQRREAAKVTQRKAKEKTLR